MFVRLSPQWVASATPSALPVEHVSVLRNAEDFLSPLTVLNITHRLVCLLLVADEVGQDDLCFSPGHAGVDRDLS